MAGLGNIVQKAFYLGVGLAAFAAEKAGGNLQELKIQAQKLADELVERGEMTAQEARQYVDDLVKQAQQNPDEPYQESPNPQKTEPRVIEIVSDNEEGENIKDKKEDVDQLKKQLESLQEELRKLKRE